MKKNRKKLSLIPKLAIAFSTIAVLGASCVGFMKLYASQKALGRVDIKVSVKQSKIEQRRVLEALLLDEFSQPIAKYAFNTITNSYDFNPDEQDFDPLKNWVKKGDNTPVLLLKDIGSFKAGEVIKYGEFFDVFINTHNYNLPRLTLKTGPIEFVNEYIPALSPDEFIEYTNWFLQNVSWGPDLVTLTKFSLTPGVETQGNSIILGSHSGTREKTQIKFSPDAFFGSMPIYSALSGQGQYNDKLTYKLNSKNLNKDELTKYLKNLPYLISAYNQKDFHGVVNYEALVKAKDLYIFDAASYLVDPFSKDFNHNSYTHVIKEAFANLGTRPAKPKKDAKKKTSEYNWEQLLTNEKAVADILDVYTQASKKSPVYQKHNYTNIPVLNQLDLPAVISFLKQLDALLLDLQSQSTQADLTAEQKAQLAQAIENTQNIRTFISLIQEVFTFEQNFIQQNFTYQASLSQISTLKKAFINFDVESLDLTNPQLQALFTKNQNLKNVLDKFNEDQEAIKDELTSSFKHEEKYLKNTFVPSLQASLKPLFDPFVKTDEELPLDEELPPVDVTLFVDYLLSTFNFNSQNNTWYTTYLDQKDADLSQVSELEIVKHNLQVLQAKFQKIQKIINQKFPLNDQNALSQVFNQKMNEQAEKIIKLHSFLSFNYVFSAANQQAAVQLASDYLYEIFNKYGYNVRLNKKPQAKQRFVQVKETDVHAITINKINKHEIKANELITGVGFDIEYNNQQKNFVLLPFNIDGSEIDESMAVAASSRDPLSRSFLSTSDSIFFNSLNDAIIKNFDKFLEQADVHNFRNLYNYDNLIKDKEVFVYDDNHHENPRFYNSFNNLLLNETKDFNEKNITKVKILSAGFGEPTADVKKSDRLQIKTEILKSYDPSVVLDNQKPTEVTYTLLAKTKDNPKGRLYDASFDDAFNTFKVAINYFDPFTPRVIKEQSQFVDNEMQKSYEIYIDVFSGLIDKVVNKRPYLMKKINGVHQEVYYDENGSAHFKVVDGEYYGFFATDRVPYLSIVAETDPSFKTTGINYLKYVGAHEYGHHQTLQYIKDISDTRDISEVGGITSRGGLSLDSLYNINVLQDYLDARSSGIGARRMKVDYTPSPNGELTNFSINAVLDNDRSKYIWEKPTDVWGADAPDKANNFYKNKRRRFLQSYEQLDEAAKLRGVKIADLFLLNAFDHHSGTLSPSISNAVLTPALAAKDLLAARYFLTKSFSVDPKKITTQYRSQNPNASLADVQLHIQQAYDESLNNLQKYLTERYAHLKTDKTTVLNNNQTFNPIKTAEMLLKKVEAFIADKNNKKQPDYDQLLKEADAALIQLTSFEIPAKNKDFSKYAGILKDGMGNEIKFSENKPVIFGFKNSSLDEKNIWHKSNIIIYVKTRDNNDVLNLTSFSDENGFVDASKFLKAVDALIDQIYSLLLVPGSTDAPQYGINGWESDGKSYSDEPISSSWAYTQKKAYTDAYEKEKAFNIIDPLVQTFGQDVNLTAAGNVFESLKFVIDRSSIVPTVINVLGPLMQKKLPEMISDPKNTPQQKQHYEYLSTVVSNWFKRIVDGGRLALPFSLQPTAHPFLRGMRFEQADHTFNQYFGRAYAYAPTDGPASAVVAKTTVAFSDAFMFNQKAQTFVDGEFKYYPLGTMVNSDNNQPLFYIQQELKNPENAKIVANVSKSKYSYLFDFPVQILNKANQKVNKYTYGQMRHENISIDYIGFNTLEEAVAFYGLDFTKYHYNKATKNIEFSNADEYAYVDNHFFDTNAYYDANKNDLQTGGIRSKASVISEAMENFKFKVRDHQLFIKSNNIPLKDLNKYNYIFEGNVGLDGVASFGNPYTPHNLTAQPASQIKAYALPNKNNVFELDPNVDGQRKVDDIIGLVQKYMVDTTKKNIDQLEINYAILADITMGYTYIYPEGTRSISTYADLFAYNVTNTQTNGSIEKIDGEYKALSSGYTQTNAERSYDKLAEVFSDYTYSLPEVLTRDYVQTTFVPSTQELDNLPNFISNLSEWNSGSEYVFAGNNTLYWTKAINDLGTSSWSKQNAVSANLMRLALDYQQINNQLSVFNKTLLNEEKWTQAWLNFLAQDFADKDLTTTLASTNLNLKALIDLLKKDAVLINSPLSGAKASLDLLVKDWQATVKIESDLAATAITNYADLLGFIKNELSSSTVNFAQKALLIKSINELVTSANALNKKIMDKEIVEIKDLLFMLDVLKKQVDSAIKTLKAQSEEEITAILTKISAKQEHLAQTLVVSDENKKKIKTKLLEMQKHIYELFISFNELKNPLDELMKKIQNPNAVLTDFENYEGLRQADPSQLSYIGQTKITNNGYFKDRWLRKSLNWELYDENRNPIIDTHIKIKDLDNQIIQDRPRAMWIYSLKSQGIGNRTLTGIHRNEQLDSTLFWGFVRKEDAPRIKKLAFKALNSEVVVYIDITFDNTNNLFYLKRQGDSSTKHTLLDEGFVSWTSDYAILANYTNALVNINSENDFELYFVDENNQRVLDKDGKNLLTLGSRKYIAENNKSYNTAPIYAFKPKNENDDMVLIKIQNQFKL
ncbi:PDxFFG protein [Ureaplasma zalophigenitalium]|uniref:PDxFFG protein n=1 Tax=Ureaplasma zalophigenitalium TaxID=907723 RepID=A0ABT3BQ82_9BACT|nr:PDxFFG protein [Ureaplasma zalophigenitalium]MCV3754128.1 PDxFFG protein [Ureaplasma zalophigenitalium]